VGTRNSMDEILINFKRWNALIGFDAVCLISMAAQEDENQ